MGELAIRSRTVDIEYLGKHLVLSLSDGEMTNLNVIWKFVGSPENRDPREWSRQSGKGFIEHLAHSLNVGKTHIIKGVRGKGDKAGTSAHWQVALEYARYFSHELAEKINYAFREWVEEERDPGLKIERAIEAYRKAGWDEERIQARMLGIPVRVRLTNTMVAHNCVKTHQCNPFSKVTDAIHVALTGHTTKERKLSLGLPKSCKHRDTFSRDELVDTRYAEDLAERRIRTLGADGNSQCIEHARTAGRAVAKARDEALSQTG